MKNSHLDPSAGWSPPVFGLKQLTLYASFFQNNPRCVPVQSKK